MPIMAALCRLEHGVLAKKYMLAVAIVSFALYLIAYVLVPQPIEGDHAVSTFSLFLPRGPVGVAVSC